MGSPKSRTRPSSLHFKLSCIGEGNGSALQCSCLENPRDRGASWSAICGVAQSRTGLKRVSSSSSGYIFALCICQVAQNSRGIFLYFCSVIFFCVLCLIFASLSQWVFQVSVVKDPLANAGDTGDESLIPGSGRSPGEGNPLQYSCIQSYLNARLSQVEQNGSLPLHTASLPHSAVCPCLALWELVASPSLVPSVKFLTSRHRDLLPPVSSFKLWVCPRSLQDHLLRLTYVLSPA